jgi:hypothetical protein
MIEVGDGVIVIGVGVAGSVGEGGGVRVADGSIVNVAVQVAGSS